jgi:hypothetical protein
MTKRVLERAPSVHFARFDEPYAQVNLILGQNPQINRIGWVAEQEVFNGSLVWKPIFVALTTNDLLFYESVPALKQEWVGGL